MRVRRIKQPLFEALQLGGNAEDVGLDLLHLLVEPFHLLAVAVVRTDDGAAERAQQSEYHDQKFSRHHVPLPIQYES